MDLPSKHCEACGRALPLTFHHLIPRTLHSNKWFKKNFTREQMTAGVMVCRDCHGAFHRFVSERDLGRDYNTLDKLLVHEEIGKFVRWVSKQRGRMPVKGPKSR